MPQDGVGYQDVCTFFQCCVQYNLHASLLCAPICRLPRSWHIRSAGKPVLLSKLSCVLRARVGSLLYP